MKGRYSEITKQILLILGVTGVVVIAAAAPGVLLAAKLFEQSGHPLPKNFERKRVTRSLRGLQNKKLIEIREKNGKLGMRLTREGRKRFKEVQLGKLRITKPPRWDTKWRMVIFDIPEESHKYAREILRGKLKEWEFYQLQKSVWVCPWPCENEIRVVAEVYGVSPYVNIVVAEKIIDDVFLRKHFNLYDT